MLRLGLGMGLGLRLGPMLAWKSARCTGRGTCRGRGTGTGTGSLEECSMLLGQCQTSICDHAFEVGEGQVGVRVKARQAASAPLELGLGLEEV